ncbi:MAG: flagellar biosynthesis protein FlhA [Bdellovibrionota bacterium]
MRDFILPLAVVLEVGMMVFPMPVEVLDALLVLNVASSLLLLLSAVHLSEPERFTSLPTILLLAALFRLGLNISTTRQLLGRGEAPDVVVAFGNFVVGGNLVVGAVIFLIITLVQFLVIAKGAERVAEVAARFTLDAMPGKQMAIDADLRAGILSLQDAREKRRELQRESKLYGALDGAMKFVKGDAIAGLIITALNISAGLVIGVVQHGLPFSAALQKYTLFTIGDGLVSQIPALLTATAAGIAVTRVADREGSSVGREMLVQLGREPQALALTAVVLMSLAFAPGLPFGLFILAGGLFCWLARRSQRARGRTRAQEEEGSFRPKVLGPLALGLSSAAVQILQRERGLPSNVQSLRAELFERFGLVVGDVQFDIFPGGPEAEAVVYFRDVPVRRLAGSSVYGAASRPNGPADRADAPQLADGITQALREVLSDYRAELIDDTQTRVLLETHQGVCEDLINSVIPKLLPVTRLTGLLKSLVHEHVSVRPLATILQAAAEFLGREPRRAAGGHGIHVPSEEAELLAEVRVALARSISKSITDDSWQLEAWVLEPALDRLLAKSSFTKAEIPPELSASLEQTLVELERPSYGGPTVVLSTKLARPVLAAIVQEHAETIRIVAADELSDEVVLSVQGELSLPLNGAREYSTDRSPELNATPS